MTVRTQPRLGAASAALVIVISLVLVSAIDVNTFTGVVSLVALCSIPMQIVLATHGLPDLPPGLAGRPRWIRGTVLCAITLASGALIAMVSEATIGGGQGSQFPPLVTFSIAAIVSTCWLAVVLGGWPFVLVNNRTIALVALLIACYALAYLMFQVLFNFEFLRMAATYDPALDPSGWFDAWQVTVFLATAVTGMFLLPAFDFRPFDRLTQPVLGIAWTGVCVAWGAALFTLGVELFDLDVFTFLIRVSIPLLFGGSIVLEVMNSSLYRRVRQPLKGVLTLSTILVLGTALVLLFQVSLLLRGGSSWGPPDYAGEVWLINATLAIAFPLLTVHAGFFGFWPMRIMSESHKATEEPGQADDRRHDVRDGCGPDQRDRDRRLDPIPQPRDRGRPRRTA